jgi:hypothetical protein
LRRELLLLGQLDGDLQLVVFLRLEISLAHE